MSSINKNKDYVLKTAKDNSVKFIRLWFTDILGFLKSFAITIDELETAVEDGMGFDGSSIEGYARIDESDMVAMPDLETFQILPWRSDDESKVARMFCDVQKPTGEPFDCDPRYVLKRALKRASDMGYDYYVGPELEYFYFESGDNPEPLDAGGYFDLTPLDVASHLRRDTVLTLQDMGIEIEYSHHEAAPSQHEIDMRYTDALNMADNVMTYKLVTKEVALKNNVYATFMPKPIFDENGSGMHVHMSLFKENKNAFFDPNGEFYLSKLAKQFITGLLTHAREITLITNQWVNSYKRLVPGYEAPVYISWAMRNRSDLIRVPEYKPGRETATRVEYRSPDPACNPYLAFAVMLTAGLDGIEKRYEAHDPVSGNVYKMSPEERKSLGIGTLPGSLHEAIQCAEESEVIRKALGDVLFEKLIADKKIEWSRYRAQISDYELDRYLSIL